MPAAEGNERPLPPSTEPTHVLTGCLCLCIPDKPSQGQARGGGEPQPVPPSDQVRSSRALSCPCVAAFLQPPPLPRRLHSNQVNYAVCCKGCLPISLNFFESFLIVLISHSGVNWNNHCLCFFSNHWGEPARKEDRNGRAGLVTLPPAQV